MTVFVSIFLVCQFAAQTKAGWQQIWGCQFEQKGNHGLLGQQPEGPQGRLRDVRPQCLAGVETIHWLLHHQGGRIMYWGLSWG